MKTVLLLVFLITSLMASVSWMFHGLVVDRKNSALLHARGIAEVFAKSRHVYAEHRTDDSPLPITFARALSASIKTAQVRIYSPYPFPINRDGGLHDSFERQAWDRLAEHKEFEFTSWEFGLLRYAVPDYMVATCVACHNVAPNTPKDDWKVGDVRGIIEVAIPY